MIHEGRIQKLGVDSQLGTTLYVFTRVEMLSSCSFSTGGADPPGCHAVATKVHLLGAINGLVAILCVGPRTGRFDGTRPAKDFAPSSPASILFGLFMPLGQAVLDDKNLHNPLKAL